LHILVLGSYRNPALRRLENLKDYLLAKGYAQTKLVKDFKFPEQSPSESQSSYNLRKSEYWIPKSDALIFVFFPRVDNTGPGYELKHLCDYHFDMAWRSIVGIGKPTLKISSLIYGLIDRWSNEFQQIFFETDSELQEDVKGALTNLLERLYFPAFSRQKDEWETFG